MLNEIKETNILFLDIETVPQYKTFSEVPEIFQELWERKCSFFKENESPAELYNRAGIYAEFGKIVCISVGFIDTKNNIRQFRVKSFAGHDEFVILQDFANLLNKAYYKPNNFLAAHNGKEFDFPFIARRMLINGIKLPTLLNIAGKKPWEVKHIDTLELWKFGDYKNYTSLQLLSAVFAIPTPKDDIKGSDVYKVYWQDNDIERIATYCQKDVLTVAQLFLKYKSEEIIKPENVFIIN